MKKSLFVYPIVALATIAASGAIIARSNNAVSLNAKVSKISRATDSTASYIHVNRFTAYRDGNVEPLESFPVKDRNARFWGEARSFNAITPFVTTIEGSPADGESGDRREIEDPLEWRGPVRGRGLSHRCIPERTGDRPYAAGPGRPSAGILKRQGRSPENGGQDLRPGEGGKDHPRSPAEEGGPGGGLQCRSPDLRRAGYRQDHYDQHDHPLFQGGKTGGRPGGAHGARCPENVGGDGLSGHDDPQASGCAEP